MAYTSAVRFAAASNLLSRRTRIRVTNESFTEQGTSSFLLSVDGRSQTFWLADRGLEFGAHLRISSTASRLWAYPLLITWRKVTLGFNCTQTGSTDSVRVQFGRKAIQSTFHAEIDGMNITNLFAPMGHCDGPHALHRAPRLKLAASQGPPIRPTYQFRLKNVLDCYRRRKVQLDARVPRPAVA